MKLAALGISALPSYEVASPSGNPGSVTAEYHEPLYTESFGRPVLVTKFKDFIVWAWITISLKNVKCIKWIFRIRIKLEQIS